MTQRQRQLRPAQPHQPRRPRRSQRPRAAALAAALALGLAATAPAGAENLEELYRAALDYDATYLSARASLDASKYRLEQTYSLRRPSVGLSVSAGQSLSRTPNANTESADGTSIAATISGSQPLFNRANDKTIEQAERVYDIARAEFDAAEQDLILRVAQAYFDVLAAQDTLANARANLKAISELVASAKRNFEVGTATITDTREAQARYDLGRATEIQAENDLITRRIVLDQLVGQANAAPSALAVRATLPPIEPVNVEEWVVRSEVEHPLVRRARLALQVARLETGKAKAGHLPVIAVIANVGRGYSSTRGDVVPTGLNRSVPYSIASPSVTAGVALTLTMPLFSGYAVQNRIKETLVLEDKSQSDLDAARRGVAQATRSLFYGVRSGAAQVAALEAAESSSKLALEATELGFKVGVRVNLDVLNAQAQLFNTRTQLARARYDVLLAGLRLRQAAGRLDAADVALVNRWLEP